jgi:hypothetical protein
VVPTDNQVLQTLVMTAGTESFKLSNQNLFINII